MNFSGRTSLVILVIAIQMVPIEALIIPMYLMLNQANLTDTAVGLTLAYLSFVLPFTVWMLRGFIAAVPIDLEEAAMVDGCTRGQAFRRIILPLAAPGLVATAVFAVIQAWNEYLFAYVLLKQNTKQTVTVWLDTFITTKGVDWGALMAASTLVALPIVIMFAHHPTQGGHRTDRRGGEGMTPTVLDVGTPRTGRGPSRSSARWPTGC